MNAAKVLDDLKRRFPNEPEYHQAVEEVLSTIEEEYNKHPEFDKANLIERLCIPDRVFQFRVTWMDDKGNIQTNMGYRVQHNNAIGPYKGGIRFHASVNLSILKFLAFDSSAPKDCSLSHRRQHSFTSKFFKRRWIEFHITLMF